MGLVWRGSIPQSARALVPQNYPVGTFRIPNILIQKYLSNGVGPRHHGRDAEAAVLVKFRFHEEFLFISVRYVNTLRLGRIT